MKHIWKRSCLLGLLLALVFGAVATLAQNGNPAYKPKRKASLPHSRIQRSWAEITYEENDRLQHRPFAKKL